MPNKQKKKIKKAVKRKLLQYSDENLTSAINGVKVDKLSMRKASSTYGIPLATLHDKLSGKYKDGNKIGTNTHLTIEEEGVLVEWAKCMLEKGFPLSKEYFLKYTAKFAGELGKPFKKDLPSDEWYDRFRKKHNLTARSSQNLTKARANVSKKNVEMWFESTKKVLQNDGVYNILNDPTRIFNCDESFFLLNPKTNKVLVPRGTKHVYNVVNCDKSGLTVLLMGNANGQLGPPMIIYKNERTPKGVVQKMPPGWGIGKSESGWSTTQVFWCYIANVFSPWLEKEQIELPIILFVDGHASHMSYEVCKLCKDKGIILVALYPNATQYLQPMDVAVFKGVKQKWKANVESYRLEKTEENYNLGIKKEDFAPLLKKTLDDAVKPEILVHGFEKCGLYPWDKRKAENVVPNLCNESNNVQNNAHKEQQTMELDDETLLNPIEACLTKNVLDKFRQLNGLSWNGPSEQQPIYEMWLQSRGFPVNVDLNTTENLVIENCYQVPDDNISMDLLPNEEKYLSVEPCNVEYYCDINSKIVGPRVENNDCIVISLENSTRDINDNEKFFPMISVPSTIETKKLEIPDSPASETVNYIKTGNIEQNLNIAPSDIDKENSGLSDNYLKINIHNSPLEAACKALPCPTQIIKKKGNKKKVNFKPSVLTTEQCLIAAEEEKGEKEQKELAIVNRKHQRQTKKEIKDRIKKLKTEMAAKRQREREEIEALEKTVIVNKRIKKEKCDEYAA